ncbi:hypothetical protein TH61_11470 [Rufibacter sp. DG15C]|uniref:GNAT family N-acetyltransferase n=1 Tax=Rufibacter sp. DG15C TaxID=1379909 RepID=UPI00078E8DC7|nr:GNAT family N-acetyltransferase [Rufibacter sp. DG15C]AMM51674.1 hypothetical protein TH61_11470 [Rufibacter sp. DG15C]
MSYNIRIIDLKESNIGEQVATLINTTFNLNLTWQKILLNTYYDNSISNSPPSFYVGAFDEAKLIGFTAFKSHDFLQNGEIINCFHHCSVCTSKEYRGKGIFPSIIEFGKQEAIKLGAGFLYGIPNHNSGPVFKKLNYKNFGPFLKVNVPNVPLLFENAFGKWQETDVLYAEKSFYQNEYQLIDAKTKEHGTDLLVYEDLGNLIWGIKLIKKIGPVNISYFSVGGMIINKPHFFKQSVKKLIMKYKINFVQFIFHNTSVYKNLFTSPKEAPFVEPFVVYPLKSELSSNDVFNFMPGIKNNF